MVSPRIWKHASRKVLQKNFLFYLWPLLWYNLEKSEPHINHRWNETLLHQDLVLTKTDKWTEDFVIGRAKVFWKACRVETRVTCLSWQVHESVPRTWTPATTLLPGSGQRKFRPGSIRLSLLCTSSATKIQASADFSSSIRVRQTCEPKSVDNTHSQKNIHTILKQKCLLKGLTWMNCLGFHYSLLVSTVGPSSLRLAPLFKNRFNATWTFSNSEEKVQHIQNSRVYILSRVCFAFGHL